MADQTLGWTRELVDQLDWHWRNQLRPRLEGLIDDEYFWEPVAGCWSLRPRGEARTPQATGGGELVLDYEHPEPSPPPVTTIAWRLAHLIVGVFGTRVARHFGGSPTSYQEAVFSGTAAGALAQLDDVYARWIEGVRGLDVEALAAPAASEPWPVSMAALVLHINREAIHHGAEICLLRDLYRWKGDAGVTAR